MEFAFLSSGRKRSIFIPWSSILNAFYACGTGSAAFLPQPLRHRTKFSRTAGEIGDSQRVGRAFNYRQKGSEPRR
jgi:hypothetical protein